MDAMPFVAFPNTALVEIVTQSPNAIMVNTLYVEKGSAWTGTQLNGLANTVWDWWDAEISPFVSDAIDLVKVRARDMSAQFNFVEEFVGASPVDGNVSAGILPGNATMTIKFGTGMAGRSRRGRNYVIGLTEDQVSGDNVAPLTVSGYIAAYEELASILDGVGMTHVVASRANCPDPETPCAGNTWPVTTYSSDGIVDSQRRRLAGRGG